MRLIEFFSKLLFVLLLTRQMSANVIKHYGELSNNDDIYKTGMNSSVIMCEFFAEGSPLRPLPIIQFGGKGSQC